LLTAKQNRKPYHKLYLNMKKLLAILLISTAYTVANAKIDTIVVSSNFFTPSNVTIVSGDSVYFQGPSSFHPVVSETGAWTTFTVSTMISSEIQTPGTYPFYCQNHGAPGGVGMSGVITVMPPPITVFINEIHYDNDGTDANEGIEIAGPAGTDLSCYELLFYNGNDSLQDPSLALSGIIPDQMCGYGTVWFAKSGIQNGPRDAVGLLDTCTGTVIQFLGWEGQMEALDGPAIGMTSVDIGVSEPGALNQSLQLIGTGTVYSDFTWSGPSASSEDFINTKQNFCVNNSILYFINSSMEAMEDAGVLSVEVSIVNPSTVDTVTVEVAYSTGTATPGSDFNTFSTQTLIFPPSNTTSQFVTVTIIDDTVSLEMPETIVLILQNETNGGILSYNTTQTITIIDNDYPQGDCLNLFFSEYMEGSGSNKAIEIYNPFVDTIDLSAYEVRTYTGGATIPNYTLALSGMIAPGDVYVISNPSASISTIITESDITSDVTFYNGDDAIGLYQNSALIDVIGEIGDDPGTEWIVGSGSTLNNTLVRKDSTNRGTTDWIFGATQWDVYLSDDSTHIGSHAMIPCPPLTADFYSPGSGCLGESICFTDLSTTLGTSIVQWCWDYGDGTTICDTVPDPCHVYTTVATYTVVLTVTDDSSNTDSISQAITIGPPAVVDAGVDQNVCATTTCVILTGSVTGGSTTGIWSTTGTGVFTPSDTNLAACYIPSTADTAAGFVYIILTSTNNGVCTAVMDTAELAIVQPSIDIGSIVIDSSSCGNNDGSITGITASGYPPFTYEWVDDSSSIVGNAANLDSVSSGSYTLTVTDSLGCTASSGPHSIADAGAPPAPTASSPATYCDGDTVADLTATGSGGMLYWYSDVGLTTLLDSGDTFISGATVTTTYYVAELGSCLGPATAVTVTINTPVSILVAGNDTICFGDSSTLLVTATGGTAPYNYVWSHGPTTSTTAVAISGTYSVYATDSLSCTSPSDSITVMVFPSLAVSISVTVNVICTGDTSMISATASAGMGGPYDYLWSNGATTSSISVTPTSTTTYNVTVSDGCSSDVVDSATVTVNPTPTAAFTSTVSGFSVDFLDGSSGTPLVGWSWNFGDGSPLNTTQNPTHVYAMDGTYNVCLVVVSDMGCVDTVCNSVVVSNVGIDENNLGNLVQLYPNPSTGILQLVMDASLPQDYQVCIYNLLGEQVINELVQGTNKTIDLSEENSGVYFITITTTKGIINKKIILSPNR